MQEIFLTVNSLQNKVVPCIDCMSNFKPKLRITAVVLRGTPAHLFCTPWLLSRHTKRGANLKSTGNTQQCTQVIALYILSCYLSPPFSQTLNYMPTSQNHHECTPEDRYFIVKSIRHFYITGTQLNPSICLQAPERPTSWTLLWKRYKQLCIPPTTKTRLEHIPVEWFTKTCSEIWY